MTMPEILVQSPDGSRQTVPLTTERVSIGRSRESDIYLPGEWLSRRHAEIQRRADGFYLVDLKSKNGTQLNGARIAEQRLAEGDEIVLGEHHLTFIDDAPIAEESDVMPPGTLVFSTRDVFDVGTPATRPARSGGWEKRILSLLSGAAAALFTHRPLAEIFEEILTLLLDAVPGAERAAILLLEGAPSRPVVKASRSRKGETISSVSRSIARKVVEEKVVLLVPNVMEDVAFKAQESILATGIRSALCAPLWFRPPGSDQDVVIGLVYLDTRRRAGAFAEDDRPVVTALANVAAAKIENARLLEESLEKRRMDDDIRMAAEIQTSLLPREAPRVPGYDLVGSTKPCRGVGGDYFDLMTHEGRLLIALGDVSGKGIGAGLLMTMLRASVRAHWKGSSVTQAMAHINETVCENTPGNKYITFFLAQLDVASGHLSYVNAGHNPPILCRADGRVENLGEGGVVLGLIENVSYAEGAVDLAAGDTLIVYSDGVSETWSAEDEEFGDARVGEVVRRGRGLDALALQAEVLRQLDGFSGGAKATDDRTLIILKRV
jgi:sigma-B regulation protein RsbU (phosphoserine phosphatase)